VNKTGNHNGGSTSTKTTTTQKNAPITWISQAKINNPHSPVLYRCTPSCLRQTPRALSSAPRRPTDRPTASPQVYITLRLRFQRALISTVYTVCCVLLCSFVSYLSSSRRTGHVMSDQKPGAIEFCTVLHRPVPSCTTGCHVANQTRYIQPTYHGASRFTQS
jgi:hypothetical protein